MTHLTDKGVPSLPHGAGLTRGYGTFSLKMEHHHAFTNSKYSSWKWKEEMALKYAMLIMVKLNAYPVNKNDDIFQRGERMLQLN